MKKILITLLVIASLFTSCSSNDEVIQKQIPEKFDIKFEIINSRGGSIPKVSISVNYTPVKTLSGVSLPFSYEYTYDTSRDEITKQNMACECITITVSAYLSPINEMEKFNLYIDGKLVDTTTITNSPINNIINPTSLEFVY